MFIFFYLVILLLIVHPSSAYAWGPATHLEYAGRAIEAIGLFAPLVKKLISRHTDHFLYGSVAADITLGKNLKGYYHNCHNWRVALDLFHAKAKKDFQKAFMLGYLGHLAADTVAHNFFVPFKMIRSWKAAMLNHVYWEMRMDLSVPEKYWNHFGGFRDKKFDEDDALLEGHLKRTFFSFKTNKRIFNSLLVLQRLKNYRKMAHRLAARSQHRFEEHDIKNYKQLATRAVVDLLSRPDDSPVLQADPTGKLKMLYAKDLVRQIKEAKNAGHLSREGEHRLMHDVKKQLQAGLYEPAELPSVDDYTG